MFDVIVVGFWTANLDVAPAWSREIFVDYAYSSTDNLMVFGRDLETARLEIEALPS
jgi:hypothetical protein